MTEREVITKMLKRLGIDIYFEDEYHLEAFNIYETLGFEFDDQGNVVKIYD